MSPVRSIIISEKFDTYETCSLARISDDFGIKGAESVLVDDTLYTYLVYSGTQRLPKIKSQFNGVQLEPKP